MARGLHSYTSPALSYYCRSETPSVSSARLDHFSYLSHGQHARFLSVSHGLLAEANSAEGMFSVTLWGCVLPGCQG